MTRGIRRSWPLVLSLVVHGVALAALAFFLVHAAPTGGGSRTPRIDVGPLLTTAAPPEEPSSAIGDAEVRYTGTAAPEPRLPVERLDDEAEVEPSTDDVSLPPLASDAERDWVRIDIPLAVAHRRLRSARPPAAPAAPAREPSREPRREEPARPPPLRPVHAPQYYPREAVARGLAGRALVEVTVHTSGVVMGTRLLESSGHEILDRAALTSAARWRFAPIPHTRRAAIPFRFAP